ncbi:leucine-rich repeat domain-containing protein [Candidatus Poribacteria bacterium]|nr:leucine-rich repeat domain-containing protein [Candidatus Poribacteria bacterium]
MIIKEIYRKSLWFQLFLASVVGILAYNTFTYAEDAEEWMPDAALRAAVREKLELPVDVALTKEKMQKLIALVANDRGIVDITGLEFATNLRKIFIGKNPITDLRPLANLTQLAEFHFWHTPPNLTNLSLQPLANLINLEVLSLEGHGISDISPLAGLKKLRRLHLSKNQIKNISPLAGLMELWQLWIVENLVTDLTPLSELNLRELNISANPITDLGPLATHINLEMLFLEYTQVTDLSPLAGLTNLRTLRIRGNNTIIDVSPLIGLNLIDFTYDEVCEIIPPGPSVIERIQRRNYPSIFQANTHVSESPEEYVLNYPSLDNDPELYHKRIAQNDLYIGAHFSLDWIPPYKGLATRFGGDLEHARAWRKKQLALNPNLVFLATVRVGEPSRITDFPPDSDVLLRHPDGELVDVTGDYHYNILRPEVQQLLIDKIVGIAACGLFDGIWVDGFFLNGTVGWNAIYEELSTFAGREITDEDIIQIYRHIFRNVRESVHPNFLILMNANVTRPDRYAEFVNGSHMETEGRFFTTYKGLRQVEEVLLWNEENLRAPQINGLYVGGLEDEPSHSPENQRRMRLATTLSLTHSDGYICYMMLWSEGTTGRATGPRLYPWYDFWDADLGYPIGEKAQPCDNCEGLFIREFTNGWAVYNRSGKPQKIQLPMQATSAASGLTNTTHIVPDLDGEMYLKQEPDTSVDGTVKVLDLPIAAPQESAAKWMPDAALRSAVRETLGLPTIVHLTKEHLLPLDELRVNDNGISDITGLEFATNLKVLYLSKNPITDLRPLANLTALKRLYLWDLSPNTPTLDLRPLATLVNLEEISLENSKVSDISPLAALKQLSELHLTNNQIEDISPLAALTELRILWIQGNPVTDFSPLSELNLTEFRSDVDVNGDGVINILDLVTVANALGKAEPDLNGDGVVNIQDLVIVANAFGNP